MKMIFANQISSNIIKRQRYTSGYLIKSLTDLLYLFLCPILRQGTCAVVLFWVAALRKRGVVSYEVE